LDLPFEGKGMDLLSTLNDFHLLPYDDCRYPSDGASNKIQLNKTSSWTYCGPKLPLKEDDLPESYRAWHRATVREGSITSSLFSFLAFAHEFFSKAGISHYWVTVRATKATPDFDTPRWHTDGDFFKRGNEVSKNQTQWKLATTLLGPGTLFINDIKNAREIEREVKSRARKDAPSHACHNLRCLGCSATSKVVRSRLSKAFKKHKVVQAEQGKCCFFRIGPQRGAVHSEPPHTGDRVFVNIVPGTEVELKQLMAKWGMKYPRAWSFGVPLHFSQKDSV
jgi:hypothetical protein